MELRQRIEKEDERILNIQTELFPLADKSDLMKALKMLKRYPELKNIVDDYRAYEAEIQSVIVEGEVARRIEAEDLYSNKTANAIILAQHQKEAAAECNLLKQTIERAVNLIRDDEAKEVITLRYLKGLSYTETMLFMSWGVKNSTMDRRLKAGITSVANTLKMWGVLY